MKLHHLIGEPAAERLAGVIDAAGGEDGLPIVDCLNEGRIRGASKARAVFDDVADFGINRRARVLL